MSTKNSTILAAAEYMATDAGHKFLKLIDVWIDSLRQANDTASKDDFLKNQGAIRELKLMHKSLSKLEKPQRTDWDGGFGD